MKLPRRLYLASAMLVIPAGVLAQLQEKRVHFGDPIQGQRLFASKGCVRCHAVRGAGGRVGPDLGRSTGDSFYEIAVSMWNHSGGMGEKMREFRVIRPLFEAEELSDLTSFLYFLNYFDEPGDPRAGKLLFSEKHCIRCHRVGEEGGITGPALDTIPRGVSPLLIAEALWNHGPEMIAAIEEASLEVPKFAGNEIIDLFAYVRSHGERTGSQRFQSPGDPAQGALAFDDKGCSACHDFYGEEPGVGPDLGRAELVGSVTQIAGRMWNHWPNMARTMRNAGMQVPVFEEGEFLDLYAYIFISRYEGEPGDPKRGLDVYESKGCSVCHRLDDRESVGPSLLGLRGQAVDSIMQSIWNHAPGMDRIMKEQSVSRVRLESGELADLLAFLAAGLEVADEDR